MKAKAKKMIDTLALIMILLFLALPTVSGSIDILDIGVGYDCVEHFGYVQYQPNSNSTGVLSVFIDGSLVKTKALDMEIRYHYGFKCNPIKTLEFPLNETEGNHSILAVVNSDNVTVQSTIGYYAAIWWTEEPEDEEVEEEIIEEWMVCP